MCVCRFVNMWRFYCSTQVFASQSRLVFILNGLMVINQDELGVKKIKLNGCANEWINELARFCFRFRTQIRVNNKYGPMFIERTNSLLGTSNMGHK